MPNIQMDEEAAARVYGRGQKHVRGSESCLGIRFPNRQQRRVLGIKETRNCFTLND